MPTKEDVSKQFGRNAKAYAESKVHASGSDLQLVLKLLAPRSDMRVLDVATGAGHTAFAVAPYVSEVVASDLSPQMIEQVQRLAQEKKLTNVKAVVADVEALPFASASFDAVTCRIAPHHFLDINKALQEIARVLKLEGVFLLEDSCSPPARRQDRFINELETLRDPTHVRAYTSREWRKMLSSAGLTVRQVRYYRKVHEVSDWIRTAGLSPERERIVYEAFEKAPAWARKQFAITYDGPRATTYSDDKIIVRTVKR